MAGGGVEAREIDALAGAGGGVGAEVDEGGRGREGFLAEVGEGEGLRRLGVEHEAREGREHRERNEKLATIEHGLFSDLSIQSD
jgi:hypothetical protein